ncbi:hypothetical protein L210DRAFT_3505327 [Boletus edulis BED1]|uniref:Uncharacterized protein n=1 Tax=Boletus edulis BED1 TaxID=1328754 RepID=A0AAD4GCY7_BOLED|nr:hypothetical protein L210DRAFT_3505327 [Boletus edulis BED1]
MLLLFQTLPGTSLAPHYCPKQLSHASYLPQLPLPRDTVQPSPCRFIPQSHTSAETNCMPSSATSFASNIQDPALYQSPTLPNRPLSHQEMVQRWCQALAKMEAIRRIFEVAQQEFYDYASDIVEVIGQPTYLHFLAMYLAAMTPGTANTCQ